MFDGWPMHGPRPPDWADGRQAMSLFRMTGKWEGLDALTAKLDGDHLLADPLADYVTDVTNDVEAHAKRNAPTSGAGGGIRQGITHTIDRKKLQGRVGSNKNYSIYVHGAFNEKKKRTRPHFPPLAPLETWARRRGIPVFLVALAIARRGTPFVPFFTIAMKATEPFMNRRVKGLEAAIKRRWSKG